MSFRLEPAVLMMPKARGSQNGGGILLWKPGGDGRSKKVFPVSLKHAVELSKLRRAMHVDKQVVKHLALDGQLATNRRLFFRLILWSRLLFVARPRSVASFSGWW